MPRYDPDGHPRPPRASPALGLLLALAVLGGAAFFATQELADGETGCGTAISPDDGFEVGGPVTGDGSVATASDPATDPDADTPCDDLVEERRVFLGVGLIFGLGTAAGLATGIRVFTGSGTDAGGGGDGGGD